MKENVLKLWGRLPPGKLTACSGAVLLVLAACGGNGSGTTEAELDRSAESQEVATSETGVPSVDVKYDNWIDDPSLPTPPSAEPQVYLKTPASNAATTATTLAAEPAPSSATAKIVGGGTATETYPFMVGVQVNGMLNCGATLIAPTWALTAAHCVAGQNTSAMTVRVNSLNRTSGGQVIAVAQAIANPLWNPQNIHAGKDIALLRLASPVSGVTPMPIVPVQPAVGTNVRALGWGQTNPVKGADSGTVTLKQLDTRISASYNCAGWSLGDLCAVATNAASPCFGDSGGPALVRYNGAWRLAGLTSRLGSLTSTVCGDGNQVFTSATAYLSWITQQMNSAAPAPTPAPTPTPPPPPPPPPPIPAPVPPPATNTPPCTNCTPYTATLVQGQTQVQPNGSYVNSATGLLRAWMTSPAGTDFDLTLYRYTGTAWVVAVESAGPGNQELIAYAGQPGYYYWAVRADAGAGSYKLYLQNP